MLPPAFLRLPYVIHSPTAQLSPAVALHQITPEKLLHHVQYRLKRERGDKTEAAPAVSDMRDKMIQQLWPYPFLKWISEPVPFTWVNMLKNTGYSHIS